MLYQQRVSWYWQSVKVSNYNLMYLVSDCNLYTQTQSGWHASLHHEEEHTSDYHLHVKQFRIVFVELRVKMRRCLISTTCHREYKTVFSTYSGREQWVWVNLVETKQCWAACALLALIMLQHLSQCLHNFQTLFNWSLHCHMPTQVFKTVFSDQQSPQPAPSNKVEYLNKYY